MMGRLTRVQQDVYDRLKAGWSMEGIVPHEITKPGEAPRHIGFTTLIALERRGVIVGDWEGPAYVWRFNPIYG